MKYIKKQWKAALVFTMTFLFFSYTLYTKQTGIILLGSFIFGVVGFMSLTTLLFNHLYDPDGQGGYKKIK